MAAIFGFQIVLSLIAASILQKLSARYSIGRWILCRSLLRYLPPSNDYLKGLIGQNVQLSKTGKRKPRRPIDDAPESFLIPKQLSIELLPRKLTAVDVLQLPYYVDFRWLIDFSIYSLAIFLISELVDTFLPQLAAKEINLSLVWIAITLFISLKSLTSVTAIYFRGQPVTGERALCLSFCTVCFLITMVIFSISDGFLDIGLLEAHRNFTSLSAEFLKNQDFAVSQERSPLFLYLILSLMFSFLGACLAFPSLRYAKMYQDALRWAGNDYFSKFQIHASFLSPLLALVLWMKPVVDDHLVSGSNSLLTKDQLESLRLWICMSLVFIRIITYRRHLQAYLNLAVDKIETLKKEGGRISNLDLQQLVNQIPLYLCVVAIQYFAPIVVVFSITCILKYLGNYRWISADLSITDFFNLFNFPADFWNSISTHVRHHETSLDSNLNNSASTVSQAAKFLQPSLLHIRIIFNQTVNRGIWNFVNFTTILLQFFGALVGVVYVTSFKN